MQLFWLGLNYYNQNCFLAQAFDLFCINRLQGKFIWKKDILVMLAGIRLHNFRTINFQISKKHILEAFFN